MPKRQRSEQMEHYRRKLRRLEDEERRKRKRIIYSTSDSEENSDKDEPTVSEPGLSFGPPDDAAEVLPDDILSNNNEDAEAVEVSTEIDAAILSALGETTPETPKFGPKVHDSLPRLWQPILLKGLSKELKEKIAKEHLIPENCSLLKAPTLNPEIASALSETSRARDKRVESVQQQLGTGISALIKGLDLLIDAEKRIDAIKVLSDGCRLLCDLHFTEGEARKKFITPGLDKAFLSLMQDTPRDEMLFGSKLAEKIKASKMIEKQGLQIKKPSPVQKSATLPPPQPSTSRQRSSGNWSAPPRYSSRGGRGGAKRGGPANRGRPPATANQSKPPYQPKQRAPNQQ